MLAIMVSHKLDKMHPIPLMLITMGEAEQQQFKKKRTIRYKHMRRYALWSDDG
jgi:hypothetical protein